MKVQNQLMRPLVSLVLAGLCIAATTPTLAQSARQRADDAKNSAAWKARQRADDAKHRAAWAARTKHHRQG